MNHYRKDISATVAYMIGIKEESLEQHYDMGKLEFLKNSKEATIIRYLNQIRTTLFLKYKHTQELMKWHLKNLKTIEYYDVAAIEQLEAWGISLVKANYNPHSYLEDINELMRKHIVNCRYLFDEWINFEYIKELFVIPNKKKQDIQKDEFRKFVKNLNNYPFQMYIHWEPMDRKNFLINDYTFFTTLYDIHALPFSDITKVMDATAETKANIYDFISTGESVIIAVDCENSNVFKLYSILKGVHADNFSKIKKIMLFDDKNTADGWEWLSKFTKIPVEYTEVERITNYKSLVDIKMTTGVCAEHYKNNIDSFVLCSSDSDFWGLISSLPEAKFLVFYETDACGEPLKKAMREHGIANCCMDDFYTGDAEKLKTSILLDKLRTYSQGIVGLNGHDLAELVFKETGIKATNSEIENFYNKYVKTMRLRMNKDGIFYIDNDSFYVDPGIILHK